jgi:hypothetical protein
MCIMCKPVNSLNYFPSTGGGGHCCTCAGVCNHIGGPWHCFQHDPNRAIMPYIPLPSLGTNSGSCIGHCYCKELKEKVPHLQCCNCGHRIKKVIPNVKTL